MKQTIILLSLLCPISIFAQPGPLRIGDPLPPISWQLLDNINTRTESAGTLNNKLIIFDFWATWCSSCYRKFPHLDSLQKEFGEKFALRLVNSQGTGDDREKIIAFYNKRKNINGQAFQFINIINDTVLKKYFPHSIVPYYVWVYKNKVIAITKANLVTEANIAAILRED